MTDQVEVRLSTLNDLRQSLLSILERQVTGLDAVRAELESTQRDLDAARQRAQRELARAKAAYEVCLIAAIAAAAAGGGGDCSGPEYGVRMATERLNRIDRAILEVGRAGEQFRQQADRHRSYLGNAVPSMRAGLQARSVSVAAYLSFLVAAGSSGGDGSPSNATRALADDIGAKQKYEGFRIPDPTEARERWGSGERKG